MSELDVALNTMWALFVNVLKALWAMVREPFVQIFSAGNIGTGLIELVLLILFLAVLAFLFSLFRS